MRAIALSFLLIAVCHCSFLSLDFAPKSPQSIPNPLGFEITLKCKITGTDASDVMLGKMLSGTGSVNGQSVPAAGISFTVKNGEVVTLTGSAGSKVEITNQGSNKVHADCDLAMETLAVSQPNSLFSFDFQPNTPQSIPNPLGSEVTLKCTISCTDASDVIFGKMLSGTGSINGQVVPAAGGTFTVKNGVVVTITGSAGSQVQLTNQGASKVHADCDFASELAAPKPNSLFSFDFQPNSPQSIPNPLGSDITLKCTISSTDASDVMLGKMISGTGSVNGQTVPASGISFTVKNGVVVTIAGSAGSEVQITNQGSSNVHADCDLATVVAAPQPNSLFSFDFQPNTPQGIPNPLGSDITLKCTISSTDASDVMFGKMKSGTGSINGQVVPAAGGTFTVKNGVVVTITGSAGSEVEITNQGSSKVHADCDFATELAAPQPNSLFSFDFQPNSPQSIPNPLGSDITLKCTISSTDASDVMFGKMLSGTGSVNGQALPASGASFTVKNGEVITLTGSAGSQVQITNQGASKVHADCDLAMETLGSSQPNSFLSFDFKPNAARSIPNPIGVDLTLKCKITSTDATDTLFGKMVSGTGSVNGKSVPASGLTFTVKNGDVVTLQSSAGSEVSILNKGASNVHADCDLALDGQVAAATHPKRHHKKHRRHHGGRAFFVKVVALRNIFE